MLPNADEGKEHQELLVGMQNGIVTLQDSLAVSYKIKCMLARQFSSYVPWFLPKRVENFHPYKNLHMDVYSSFLQNCQNLEATKSPSVGE